MTDSDRTHSPNPSSESRPLKVRKGRTASQFLSPRTLQEIENAKLVEIDSEETRTDVSGFKKKKLRQLKHAVHVEKSTPSQHGGNEEIRSPEMSPNSINAIIADDTSILSNQISLFPPTRKSLRRSTLTHETRGRDKELKADIDDSIIPLDIPERSQLGLKHDESLNSLNGEIQSPTRIVLGSPPTETTIQKTKLRKAPKLLSPSNRKMPKIVHTRVGKQITTSLEGAITSTESDGALNTTTLKPVRAYNDLTKPDQKLLPQNEGIKKSSSFQNSRKIKESDHLILWFESGVHVTVRDNDRRYPCICLRVLNKSYDNLSKGGSLDLFHSHTSLEIAQQLTVSQHRMYSSVQPRELLMWVTAKNKKADCPNLHSYVSHFNRIASWACQAVVTQMERSARRDILTKIIEVCRHCHDLRNYMAVQALVSAFHHSSIERMKKTLAGMSVASMKEIESCSTLMSQVGNFSAYRQRLATSQPPHIPYVG
jgi:hypothetical protein